MVSPVVSIANHVALVVSPSFMVVGLFVVVLVALLVWGAWSPLVWRLLSVVGMGAGAGLLVWGILLAAMKDPSPLGSPAGIIAVGAGVLVGSIALLVVSFCRGRA
jgi:hypothetical protein